VVRFRLKFWLLLLVFLTIVTTGPFFWLPWFGGALVRDDGPAKADFAVVLAGDWNGHRVLHAAELARQGYVRGVLVSGPSIYGIHECDLAIQYAVRQGYAADSFAPLPNDALSTREEARLVLEELKRRGAGSFLLVTSDYHTARAGRIFGGAMRQMGGGPTMRLVAAPDKYFRPDNWWKSRQGLKIVFMEWSKTVATAFGV
jgi:uncharacterized SAM-binding protein YcdF (DUF218 family)